MHFCLGQNLGPDLTPGGVPVSSTHEATVIATCTVETETSTHHSAQNTSLEYLEIHRFKPEVVKFGPDATKCET